jgi:hypothetical protein
MEVLLSVGSVGDWNIKGTILELAVFLGGFLLALSSRPRLMIPDKSNIVARYRLKIEHR